MIKADAIEGDDLILYPGDGNAENHSQYPQGIVELSGVRIENLQLIKKFNLDQYNLKGNAKLVITAGNTSQNVTSGQLLLKTPELSADKAVFSGLTIDERNAPDTEEGIKQMITLRAPDSPNTTDLPGGTRQVDLTGGSNPGLQLHYPRIRATYLATNTITLPNLGLEVQYDYNNDGVYEYGGV